jgi:ubiquinone/menaquinone biosynthesis C-methylase UbiE
MRINFIDLIKRYVTLTSRHKLRSVNNFEGVSKKYSGAWLSRKIPIQQWHLAEVQLKKFESGESVAEFDVFSTAIEHAMSLGSITSKSVLEIGCSSGYYGKVLAKAQPELNYVGLDYSQNFIDLGKSKFPDLQLFVGDTRDIRYKNRTFGIVVSGGVLLHVYEWESGINESCRVADSYLILHRTPVSTSKTKLFTKSAYGTTMIQWTFNESELINCARNNAFQLVQKWPVYQGITISESAEFPSQFTYLFRRA